VEEMRAHVAYAREILDNGLLDSFYQEWVSFLELEFLNILWRLGTEEE
jgi:hypothetical protein